MNTSLSTLVGLALLLIVVNDVYATILHARARGGLISETINRTLWSATRAIAFRLSRQQRHRLLNSIGPLLLPLLIGVLIVFLVIGFALIYFPHMPASFYVAPEAESPRWIESLYLSGITLTTVGYGDIAPHSVTMRLIALVQAASGFVLISLGVTYLVTVYSALERKRTVALTFYHRADQGADAAGFIAHHFVEDKFYGLDVTMRAATRDIQTLLEAHVEHPIIHYFHPTEVHKSMPRILFLILEVCAVIKSCLDREEYAQIWRHPEMHALDANARYTLATLTDALKLNIHSKKNGNLAGDETETPEEERRRWHRRWLQTMNRLQEEGIKVNPDKRASWADYSRQRRDWEAQLYRFATYLGYDWDEITGDSGLEYAANEDMEEPEKRARVETAKEDVKR
jgi:hypothetical protein